MAMSLNRAQLIGNLTRDPELRQIPGGSTVASFGIATNFSWTDQGGQRQEKVEFHNIVAWRKLAEICGQYLKKGSKVYIEGRIQTRDWEGEDGVKRYRTEIVAENMIMLDRKGTPLSGEEMMPYAGRQSSHGGLNRKAAVQKESVSGAASVADGAAVMEAAATGGAADGDGVAQVTEDEVTIDDLPFWEAKV